MMQITPGMKVSDVCSFCFEHTIDQPCPEREAWEQSQQEDCAGTGCGSPSCLSCGEHPADCLACQDGHAMIHAYEPSGDNPYEEI